MKKRIRSYGFESAMSMQREAVEVCKDCANGCAERIRQIKIKE